MDFRVLGPLRVHGDDGPLPVRGPREQRILALLLLNHDRLVPLDQLIRAVWDDSPPATAGTQVRNRVSELRRSWAAAVRRPEEVLRTESNGYLLRLHGHTLDLAVYERQVDTARTAARSGERPAAVRLLRSALGLWHGPAFAGVGGSVIEAASARWEEHRLSVVEECLGHELALGRHESVVDEVVVAFAKEFPFRERFVHHLMLALYRSGRQADALAGYHRYADQLREELGLDPGPELRKLHEAVLRRSPDIDVSPANPAPQPSPSVPEAPASSRRQTGTAQPVIGPVVMTRPAELPADLVDFSGRAAEIAALDRLYAQGRERRRSVQIIAVTGTAGVGKPNLENWHNFMITY